jgi:hypothetical protein
VLSDAITPEGAAADPRLELTTRNVAISMKKVTAGTYYLQVGWYAFEPPAAQGGVDLPDNFTHPCTLTVTQ